MGTRRLGSMHGLADAVSYECPLSLSKLVTSDHTGPPVQVDCNVTWP